jgi:hypothetical protein
MEARGLGLHAKSASRVADARALLSKYQIPAEELIPRRRIYKDEASLEDACIQLRAAAYARQGFGFEAHAPAPRYQGGQAEDPQQSLRDADDFDWDYEWWDRSEHERAANYHRALASKAKTLDAAVEHFKCADAHDKAARQYPGLNQSVAARQASKNILREKENCL